MKETIIKSGLKIIGTYLLAEWVYMLGKKAGVSKAISDICLASERNKDIIAWDNDTGLLYEIKAECIGD